MTEDCTLFYILTAEEDKRTKKRRYYAMDDCPMTPYDEYEERGAEYDH